MTSSDIPRSQVQARRVNALVASGGSPVRRDRFDVPARRIASPVDIARARRSGLTVRR